MSATRPSVNEKLPRKPVFDGLRRPILNEGGLNLYDSAICGPIPVIKRDLEILELFFAIRGGKLFKRHDLKRLLIVVLLKQLHRNNANFRRRKRAGTHPHHERTAGQQAKRHDNQNPTHGKSSVSGKVGLKCSIAHNATTLAKKQ